MKRLLQKFHVCTPEASKFQELNGPAQIRVDIGTRPPARTM